jgi:hypothetical protein
MAVSSLRERLKKLQSKTRNSNSETSKSPNKRQKKSFFNTDAGIDSEHALEEVSSNRLPHLHFSDVDFSKKVNSKVLLYVGERLSNAYLFPQIGVGVGGNGLLSQNSKTSRISRQYPKIFIKDQLYTFFNGQETQVDLCVDELVSMNKIRILDMNFENFGFTVLIINDEFNRIVNSSFKESQNIQLEKFQNLIQSNFQATQLINSQLLDENLDISMLISYGLICISASEPIPGIYNITLPHLGGLLRVIKNSVKWIIEITSKTRERMILDSDLREKWFKPYKITKTQTQIQTQETFKREYYTTDRVGTVKAKQIVTGPGINIVKFRGIGLDWILSLMLGTGILEEFESPVGFVYKWTGKLL